MTLNARRLAAGLALATAVVLAARPAAAGDADRAELDRLEQRSRAFYQLLERGERQQASAAWSTLEADLDAFAGRLRTRLDGMRDEVMERDGDLEELYRSPRWRDPEVAALVATYHLAWVRYQGAQLVSDAARRKALLQRAIEGFSQFLLVNEVPEIYAESLYGRGLAFLDLGETAKAIDDFNAAAEEPGVGAKARAALEEARRRASGRQGPAEADPETLLARLADLLPRAAGGDQAAEKDATVLARGLAARGGTWPSRVSTLVTEKVGGAGSSASSSYGLFLLGQLAVDRGRCEEVSPLAEKGATLRDPGRGRHRPELLFLAGGCLLNGGHAAGAATQLEALLQEFPTSARAAEAAYYRFRALDVARGTDPGLTPAYEAALGSYVARYGEGERSAEARWLLAELHRSSGKCSLAEPEYAALASGSFATRARLGSLECRIAGLATDAGGATQQRRREAVAAARAFVHDTPARGEDEPRVARVALLGALVSEGSTPADHAAALALLDGFESRYPQARDLHSRAREARLGARVESGDLEAAAPDLEAVIAERGGGPDRRRLLVRLGRKLATEADGEDAAKKRALGLARLVYGTLAAESADAADRIALADLTLRAGEAGAARRIYEEVLATDSGSMAARRGAARAAAAAGDRQGALAHWRGVVEASPPGGTAWYEARLAEIGLLADDGRRGEACEVLHASRVRTTSAGADQLAVHLQELEPAVCGRP